MSTEYYNSQWQMPNEANQSKQSNYSMSFDGSGSQYINFGTDVLVDSTSSFSISVWCYINDYNTIQFPGIGRFKTDQSTGFFFGVSNSSGYEGVYFGSNSNFVLGKTSGDISGDFVGQWKHITIVFDGVSRTTLSSYKVYVDGSEVSTTTSGSFNTVANENRLGEGNGSGTYLDGKLDAVAIFNYALSASQVTTLYGSSSTGIGDPMSLSPAPKAYYPLSNSVWNGSSYVTPNNAVQDYVFDFDAANVDHISNNIDLSSATSLTISGWINRDSTSDGQWMTILANTANGHSVGVWLGLTRSNWSGLHQPVTLSLNISGTNHRLGGQWQNDTTLPTKTIDIGKWYHVAATWDGTIMKLFLNGELADQETASSSWTLQAGAISGNRIGVASNNGYMFRGQMSNFNIWVNNYLSDTEVATLYNNGSPIKTLASIPKNSNLKAWYKLNASDTYDSSTGNWTIEDHAGSNDGTSSGMSRSNLIQSDLSRVFNNRTLAFHGGYLGGGGLRATTQSGLLNPTGSSFSVSIWLRNNTMTSFRGIFAKNDGSTGSTFPPGNFGMFYDDSSGSYSGNSSNAGKLVFVFASNSGSYTASDSIASAETIQQNMWYNVVVTHTPGDTKMYLNGSVDSVSTSITKSSFPDGYFTLSACFQNGNNWRGALSDLSFFDTVLSASEVKEIWNNGLPGDLNQHSKVDQLKDWIGIGNNYSGFTSGNTCLINYKKAPNMYGTIGALYSSTWNTIGTTGFGDSTGTSSGFSAPSNTVTNIVTNAPYSDKNAVSVNMWNQYSASQPNATITSGISDSTPQAT